MVVIRLNPRPQGDPAVLIKQITQTLNNDSTMQNDDDLRFGMRPNRAYSFYLAIFFQAAAFVDFKLDFTVPALASARGYGIQSVTTLLPFATDTVLATTGAPIVDCRSFFGQVVNGANAGNLQLRWAQQNATPSDLDVLRGSTLAVYGAN